MSIPKRLAIVLVAFLSAMAFTTTASAQADGAGNACGSTVSGLATDCGLGGQIRGQIGDGLPLPISIAPGYSGAFIGGNPLTNVNITIKSAPVTPMGNPLVGLGLGQAGQIKPTPVATIMQTTGPAPRKISQQLEVFGYGPQAEGSIGVINFNIAVFAVQTNLVFDSPHPGFTIMGTVQGPNTVVVPGVGMSPGGNPVQHLSAGGRSGAATVSYYAGATGFGTKDTNYGNGVPPGIPIVPSAGNGGGVNGVARFTSTGNQFGGVSTGRTGGTAKVYFNVNAQAAASLPCTGGGGCVFGRTTVVPGTTGVAGGPFGGSVNNAANTGFIFTGTMGFNGTIVNTGFQLTDGGGNPLTFMGQAATSVGFPLTTGRLTIEVTDLAPGAAAEKFIRTGIDARDSGGNGVIALVSGSMSARTTSKGNANRTWVTLEIPEPSAIFAASAGLFALFGCHQMVRRRSR
jgi:hypothetical protein